MKAMLSENQWRAIRAGWRDTILLLREFRRPLMTFFLVTIGGGIFYYLLSILSPNPLDSPVQAIYHILTLSFLNPYFDFPQVWYLQVFYFLMPILSLGIVAQGLAEFGVMLFNRRARGKEWEMAVASTFSNHVLLIGLGHLGYRVVKQLHDLGQDVVVIEQHPDSDLAAHVRGWGIPVIADDGTREAALESGGIRRARSIILCTQNDSLNLQMALKARGMNPKVDVIVRIFEDDFASALQQQFGFRALSATGMAAPIFAALAADVDITAPITINGEPNSLARMVIANDSPLIEKTVDQIEDQFKVSLVMIIRDGKQIAHPEGNFILKAGDSIAFLGSPQQISILAHRKSNRNY